MTELDQLPTTESGHVVKRHAMQWLSELETHTDEELKESVTPKPSDFTGSKYATEISDVRVTGTPEFIEAVASLLKPLLEFEGEETRVEIKLERTEDRSTGELTENFAFYLSVAERG